MFDMQTIVKFRAIQCKRDDLNNNQAYDEDMKMMIGEIFANLDIVKDIHEDKYEAMLNLFIETYLDADKDARIKAINKETGEIIRGVAIKGEYTTVLGQKVIVIQLDNTKECAVIEEEYDIIEE